MEESVRILCGGEPIGTAQVRKEGLYYRVECQCRKETQSILRLAAHCEGGTVMLGVLCPNGDRWTLETKIAAKHFKGRIMQIAVVGQRSNERFVPIYENKPFAYLSEVRYARFAIRSGQLGMIVSETDIQSDGAVV